jgi:hypothetical protein
MREGIGVGEAKRWQLRAAFLMAALVGCAVPRICRADPAQPSSDGAGAKDVTYLRRWYGWQTFTTDGVAAGLFLGAVADHDSTPLFGTSAIAFGLGAPIVHLAHGQWEMAIGSVGLRIAGASLGALIGSQSDVRTSSDGAGDRGADASAKWTTVGVALGGLAASAMDGLVLAYDTRPVARHGNQLLRVDAFPQIVLLRSGLALGYSGAF